MRIFASLILLAAPLAAQTPAAHPDLSGTWVLDASKNVVDGQLPAPTAATYVVGQHGDSITVDMKYTDVTGDMQLKKLWATDGYNWINFMTYQGTEMKLSSVAKWNGPVLAIQTASDFAGTPVTQNDTWTVDAEKKTLTVVTTTNVNGTYFAQVTLVFNKK